MFSALFQIDRKFRREHRHADVGPRRRFKGGGGTTQTTTNSGPPAQVLANYNAVYNQAQGVANQPQQSYGGPTLAGFTPMQQQGFNDINTAANAGQPFINQASGKLENASTMLDPSNFGGTVAQYQSPYTQKVVDATQAQFNNQNAIQQNQLAGNAASAGAFGGDRQAVAQAVLAGQQQLNQAPTIAGLYNTGFQNASNAAQSNAWLNSQAGMGFANLGQEAQQQGLTAAQAEMMGGAQQQAMAQQELNIPYQAWQAAQSYPFQTTNWLEGMATGTGSLSGGQGSTSSPGPALSSQIAGLGLTGLAGYNLYNQAQGAGGGAAAAADSGAWDSTFGGAGGAIDSGAWAVARGGGIPGFAPGGAVPGDVAVNVNGIPTEGGPRGNGLLGGGGNLLQSNTGSTTTSDGGPNTTGGEIGSVIGGLAAAYFGTPAAAPAGAYVGRQIGQEILARGGKVASLEEFARRRLPQVPVRPRGFDTGGDVGYGTPTGLTASVGGNPQLAQLLQSYTKMPIEQLQQIAMRPSAGVAGGQAQQQAAQRALQMRRMNPSSGQQPSVPGGPQGGMSPMMGQPGQGQTPGMVPMSRGGEAEDDDELPGLIIPQVGPSIPGGMMAGFAPVPAEAALAPVALGGVRPMGTAPATHADSGGTGIPRGIRNNNPLNLSYLPGQGAIGSDGRFGKYQTMEEGVAADVRQLQRYQSVHGLNTIGDIISRWAPPTENNTGAYASTVARAVGVNPHDPISLSDPHTMTKLISAMGKVENGRSIDEGAIRRGVHMALGDAGAKRGGAIRRADGGATLPIPSGDYVNYDANGNEVPVLAGLGPMVSSDAASGHHDVPMGDEAPGSALRSDAASGNYGPTSAPARARHVSNGGGGTIPLPPTPPDNANAPSQAGLGAMRQGPADGGGSSDPDTGESTSFKASPWESLLTAGLGMMAGKSPNPLANIGAGGLAGIKDYQTQRQLAIQDQMRADAAKTNAVWRAGQLGNMQDRTQAYKDATTARASAAQQAAADREAAQSAAAATRQDALKMHQEDMEFRHKQAESGTFSFQPVTQPDPDDPSKTVAGMMRLNNKTGESQFIPTNTNPNKTGAAGGLGSRDSNFFQRVTSAGNLAKEALKNIMELPSTTSSGWWAQGITSPSGVVAATKNSLANHLTSSDVQEYNKMLSGVSRNLAAIETSGLAPSGALTHSLDSLALKEGDSGFAKLRTMAEMRQIIEMGLATNLTNPKLSTEQKQMVQGIIDDAKRAVPFTNHDITQLQNAQNPRETMTDFMRKKGLGGGQTEQPAGGAGQPAKQAPPAAAIDMLKSKPELASQFEAIFGSGSSRQYLGGP